jgi:hypothetical protein
VTPALAVLVSGSAFAAPEGVTLPTGRGLPVRVRVGVQYVDVGSVDENAHTFDGTVDLRAVWIDGREASARRDVLELRGEALEGALDQTWIPELAVDNLVGEPARLERTLSVAPSGELELLQRVTGTFAIPFDPADFPFDRNALEVAVAVRGDDTNRVALDFVQADLAFSHANPGVVVPGFDHGLVDLRRAPIRGWHDVLHSRVVAALAVRRVASTTIPAVFLPLFASLLIPLLATWLNDVEDGSFKVDAFELANVVVGGLFAVIALNFAIASSYTDLASGDNTVNRLFALNYSALGVALLIVIVLYRFRFVERWLGASVQEELFRWLVWGVPTIVFGAAVAVVSAAWAG